MSPRALLLCTTNTIGGTEQVVLALARHLSDDGFETTVAFPADPPCGALLEWASERGVHAIAHPAVPYWEDHRDLRRWRALRSFVRSVHPEVTNIHYGGNLISVKDVLAIRAARSGRCVASPHHAVALVGGRRRMATALGAAFAHRVVVTTPLMMEILVGSGVPRSRIEVISNGVEPRRNAGDREAVRAAYGLEAEDFVLCTVCRLEPSKGIDDLLSALRLVPQSERHRVRLVVVGEGSAGASLRRQAAETVGGMVQFLGRVPDVSPVYAASDLFVLPSHEEGFGLVFAEAGAHGLASIGARVGGVEYAIEHGRSGLLVPDRDPVALASAITFLSMRRDLCASMGAEALRRSQTLFSMDSMVKRYEAVLFPSP